MMHLGSTLGAHGSVGRPRVVAAPIFRGTVPNARNSLAAMGPISIARDGSIVLA